MTDTAKPAVAPAAPTSAPQAAGQATGTAVGVEPAAKKVFPPLDPSTVAPQLFWLALTFAALYLMLSRVALPRIGSIIEERRDRIRRDMDAAERLKGETDKAMLTYEKALNDARTNASGIARETRDRLAAETDKEKIAVESQLTAKLTQAEARIGEAKKKALASVNEIAADTAGSIVKQLIGQDVSADDVKRALQAVAGK